MTRRSMFYLFALSLLLLACGQTQAPPTDSAQSSQPTSQPVVAAPTSTIPAAPPIDPAQPCARELAAGQVTDQAATTELEVSYDRNEQTILLGAGTDVSLPTLSAALSSPDLLREVAPGEWLLAARLQIAEGASLQISAPAVRWLKLRSDTETFVSLEARGGDLRISDTCVTSWDEANGRVDIEYRDGRSFILARDGSQMIIERAELRYLGYDADQSFGLAWRLQGTGGQISQSIVSHNYFGLYSYEVNDLVIQDNEVHHNVLYGIDPHTGSNNLRIERNVVHDNGKHGIILADNCSDGIVRENVVYNNLHHGIVIYQHSDRNLVELNQVFRNGAHGININQASNTTVRANRVYENLETGIGVGQEAAENLLEQNEIHANQVDGIRLFSDATRTTIQNNQIGENARYGVYVDSDGGAELIDNTIFGNLAGVLLKGRAEVSPDNNTFYGNRDGDIKQGG